MMAGAKEAFQNIDCLFLNFLWSFRFKVVCILILKKKTIKIQFPIYENHSILFNSAVYAFFNWVM